MGFYYQSSLTQVLTALTKEASVIEEEKEPDEGSRRTFTDEELLELLASNKEPKEDKRFGELTARDWQGFFNSLNFVYFVTDILCQDKPEYLQAIRAVQTAIGLAGHKGESSLDLLSAIRKLATFPKEEIDAETFAITFKTRFVDLIRQFNSMINGGINPSYYEFYRIFHLLRNVAFCCQPIDETPYHLHHFIEELDFGFTGDYLAPFSPRDLRSDYGRHIAGKFNQIAMWLENLK